MKGTVLVKGTVPRRVLKKLLSFIFFVMKTVIAAYFVKLLMLVYLNLFYVLLKSNVSYLFMHEQIFI